MSIKAALILGGVFFMMLGLVILILQGGMQEAFFFIFVGISFFFALDWHNARQPVRSTLRIEKGDDEASEASAGHAPPEEGEDGLSPSDVGGGGGGGGGGSSRMSHLEIAEALLQNIIAEPSEASVEGLVQKGLAEVTAMGYTEKGIQAFLGKLGGGLSAMTAPPHPEQAMKNRNAALLTLARMRKQAAAASPPSQ